MPRLFTSHRAAPSSVRARPLVNLSSLNSPSASPLLKRKMVASPEQPPIQLPIQRVVAPPAPIRVADTPSSQSPLVLVPPVPPFLARLMDSHDLDNPYLVAAFNVLIANDNNPMRVPDILNAVQRNGWTQVLHRHKDRPEQLFGNALRAHQRRREMINKPSLVFMVDAGSCWKHHEIDLSAASGRRKGKIWCFSTDAGFPCPYARLGWDLKTIIAAQNPSEEQLSSKVQNGKTLSVEQENSRKRRKVEMTSEVSARYEAAVRGAMASVHHVASAPPPHIPAAISGSASYNTQSFNPVRTPALPLDILPRAQTIPSSSPLDLDDLIPLSPHSTCAALDDDNLDIDHQPTRSESPTPVLSSPDTSTCDQPAQVLLEDVYASDDDDDDYHVTMRNFTVPEERSPLSFMIKLEPDLDHDADTESSSFSSVRTPTPPLVDGGASESSGLSLLLNDTPFHGHVSQEDEPIVDGYGWNWDLTREMCDLGGATIPSSGRLASPQRIPSRKLSVSAMSSNDVFDFVPSRSREASVFSICSSTSNTVSSCTSPMSLNTPASSRANSIFSLSGTSSSPSHPLILYSPSLTPFVVNDQDRPFKNGLAHNYFTIGSNRDVVEMDWEQDDVKELENMLDWNAGPQCPVVTLSLVTANPSHSTTPTISL